MNLFDIINPNFFGVLAGRNRASNFLLIVEISKFFGSRLTVERKKLIDYISEQIKIMHIEDVGDDFLEDVDNDEYDSQINSYNQKSNIFISYLEKRGWLERDRNEEFVDIVQRTDAFIEILSTLIKLISEETDAKEQSTALLSLYRNIVHFDFKHATSSIESIELASNELEHSILAINSKIKRFVNKIMADSSLTEREILTKLTVDYQKLSAFISFHNLQTKNDPSKYSSEIINKLYDLQNEQTMNDLINDYCITKDLDVNKSEDIYKAKQYICSVFENVLFQIENIEESLETISARNSAYTSSSVDRINFRLNNERDIKGDINSLLKDFKNMPLGSEFTAYFDFYSFNEIDAKSTFTARALSKIAPKETAFIKHEVNPLALAKAEELIKKREMYSIQAVNKFVIDQLGPRESLKASELCIENLDSFIKTMLIPVYSTNSGSLYYVKKIKHRRFACLEFDVDDFEIFVRKEN